MFCIQILRNIADTLVYISLRKKQCSQLKTITCFFFIYMYVRCSINLHTTMEETMWPTKNYNTFLLLGTFLNRLKEPLIRHGLL